MRNNLANNGTPLIEEFLLDEDVILNGKSHTNEILFVLKGMGVCECDFFKNFEIVNQYAYFIPVGNRYEIKVTSKMLIVLIRLDLFSDLPETLFFRKLIQSYQQLKPDSLLQGLFINEKLQIYLTNLGDYIRDGFISEDFFKIKILELLYILNGYYSKDILSTFFQPIVNKDFVFTEFVYDNWQSVKSAKELAAISPYCETSFARKFKNVFGVSPYKWLNKKKAAKVYNELSRTNKPLKLIAEENWFTSQQHLNDYCIRNFSATPGSIRLHSDKKRIENIKKI